MAASYAQSGVLHPSERDTRFRFGTPRIVLNITSNMYSQFMSEDTRPIDLWMLAIELLVLVVIAGEAALSLRSWYDKRKKRGQILALMSKGQALERCPPGHIELHRVNEWVQQVDAWITQTDNFLKTCSPQASAEFQSNIGMPTVMYPAMAPGAEPWYKTILVRLANLRNIMEKPDTYY